MHSEFQSFEPQRYLASPRSKTKSKTSNHEDFILNSRKPTIPKPFNLNTIQRSTNLKRNYNFRSNKQKNHSIPPTQKKNLYGSHSPSHLDYLSTPDSTSYKKSFLNSKVSLRLRQKMQPYDSKHIESRPATKDEFFKYKVSLKLMPKLNLNKEPKWSPTIKLNDLINFH